MKAFIGEDYMLQTATAQELYNKYASELPIIDYHCHIPAREIFEDHEYRSMTEIWLGGDHYKWRAMRVHGIPERLITGDGSDYEKFRAYAELMPKLAGSPLYAWSHLELKRYFGITEPLSIETCDSIWNKGNEILKQLTVREILRASNVQAICTTDDPVDTLEWHRRIREEGAVQTKVYPAFRPDKAVEITAPTFKDYIATLGDVCSMEIKSFADMKAALLQRIELFAEMGCRASDHGLSILPQAICSEEQAERAFGKMLGGEALSDFERDAYRMTLIVFLAGEYVKRDWVMELHYGVIRNSNDAAFRRLGADTGFDTVGTEPSSLKLAAFLNCLNENGALTKTIVFPINNSDTRMVNTICGAYTKENVRGFVQQGAAWWFNDTKCGMIEQLRAFSELSVLGDFVGMLTDSRSFLSYTRHEYFRRIFCNFLADMIENGEYPRDFEQAGSLIQDVSYGNAERFFRL